MQIQPQTIFNDLVGQINDYVTHGGHYQEENSFRIRRIISEIEKLGSGITATAQKHMLFGAVAQICGNENQMRSSFAAAKRIQDNALSAYQFSAALANLGYVSESQKEFLTAANPESGYFSKSVHIGFSNLSINTLHDYFVKAMSMGLANINQDDIKLARRVKDVLAQDNVTDEFAAAIMDQAGHVLRKHGLMRFSTNTSKNTSASELKLYDLHGGKPFVMVIWNVPVPTHQAAIMNAELSERLAEAFETLPDSFSIGFQGVVQ